MLLYVTHRENKKNVTETMTYSWYIQIYSH